MLLGMFLVLMGLLYLALLLTWLLERREEKGEKDEKKPALRVRALRRTKRKKLRKGKYPEGNFPLDLVYTNAKKKSNRKEKTG